MLRKLLLIFLSTIGFCILIYSVWNWLYYRELRAIKKEFNKIEGVKIVSIGGNEDVDLEDIYCTIELPNGGKIGFFSLSLQEFDSLKFTSVSHVDNWHFFETGCINSGRYAGGSLDFGSRALYPELNSLGIKNIKDIILNYNKISAFVETIPTHPDFDTIVKGEREFFFQKFDFYKTPGSELRTATCK